MIFLLACVTMVIDHIWLLFFSWRDLFSFIPGKDELRMIGRIAFPLFAWGIVRGYRVTRDKNKYLKRLFLLAVGSQIPFLYINISLNIDIINVIFTLLFWLLSILVWEEQKIDRFLKVIMIAFLAIFASYFHFDYGAYGVLSVFGLHVFWQQKKSVLYFLWLTFLFYNIDYTLFKIEYHVQIFSAFAIGILYFTPLQQYDFRLNTWFKYLFYPVHFAVLLVIYYLML